MPGFTQVPNDWVFDDPFWTSEPFTKPQAYIDLFKLAQFNDGMVNKRGIIIKLNPGQIGWSMKELANRWKRGIKWVRNLLTLLEQEGHITVEKTNVSSTITLLRYVHRGNAKAYEKEPQRNRKGDTNNIVNMENTEHTLSEEMVTKESSISTLWELWIDDDETKPTNGEKKILLDALAYNSDVDGFWVQYLEQRRRILKCDGYVAKNMKYWFSGGFREMEDAKKSTRGVYISPRSEEMDHGF